MQNLSLAQIERAVDSWKSEDRRLLLSHLAKRYQKDFRNRIDEGDIENFGWMILAQSSLGFWDNPKDAMYDRV